MSKSDEIFVIKKERWVRDFTPPTEPYPVFGKESMKLDGIENPMKYDGFISDFRITKYGEAQQYVQRTGFRLWLKNIFLKSYFFVSDVVRWFARR